MLKRLSSRKTLLAGLAPGRRLVLRSLLASLACAGLGLPAMATECQSSPCPADWPVQRETRLFMGTMVSIAVAGNEPGLARQAMDEAFALGRRLEAVFSRFDSASPVSQLNRQGRLADAPQDLLDLLARARQISTATDGLFDVTVLPLLGLGGQARQTEPDAAMREAMDLVGYWHLDCGNGKASLGRAGMGITLDGIAKGRVADAMSARLAALGFANHLVNAGGDIVAAGQKGHDRPWRVGIANPLAPSHSLTAIELPSAAMPPAPPHHAAGHISGAPARNMGGMALATSGMGVLAASRLVNPKPGPQSMRGATSGMELADMPASATVLAADGLTADALATAICLLPAGEAIRLVDAMPDCACCLVLADGSLARSRDWPSTPVAMRDRQGKKA